MVRRPCVRLRLSGGRPGILPIHERSLQNLAVSIGVKCWIWLFHGLMSWGGMTEAHCSPGQADGLPLSHKMDIWCWQRSVLEMYKGEMTWTHGRVAPAALGEYLQTEPDVSTNRQC